MATINTFQDLKRVLEENPDWLNELRQLILTDELLTLPTRFDEYALSSNKRMDALAEMIAENGKQIAENGKQIAENGRLIAENGRLIAENSRQVSDMRRDVEWLKGESLENRLVRLGYSMISDSFNLGKDRLLRPGRYGRASQDFNDRLWDALADGVITRAEYRRLLRTDAIIQTGINMDREAELGYIVVEASYTANTDDIDRAELSAVALSKIYPDVPIRASIYCVVISDRLREEAKQQKMSVVIERNLGK